MGDVGATKIAETMSGNKTLLSLSMFSNSDIRDNNIGDVGATKIAEAMIVNKSLTNLGILTTQI